MHFRHVTATLRCHCARIRTSKARRYPARNRTRSRGKQAAKLQREALMRSNVLERKSRVVQVKPFASYALQVLIWHTHTAISAGHISASRVQAERSRLGLAVSVHTDDKAGDVPAALVFVPTAHG